MKPPWLTAWLRSPLEREISSGIMMQRIIRKARAEAAQRGVSTYWKRAGDKCRAMYGEQV